jgi:hypothetical protein
VFMNKVDMVDDEEMLTGEMEMRELLVLRVWRWQCAWFWFCRAAEGEANGKTRNGTHECCGFYMFSRDNEKFLMLLKMYFITDVYSCYGVERVLWIWGWNGTCWSGCPEENGGYRCGNVRKSRRGEVVTTWVCCSWCGQEWNQRGMVIAKQVHHPTQVQSRSVCVRKKKVVSHSFHDNYVSVYLRSGYHGEIKLLKAWDGYAGIMYIT